MTKLRFIYSGHLWTIRINDITFQQDINHSTEHRGVWYFNRDPKYVLDYKPLLLHVKQEANI